MSVTIYHNPQCSKSRQALALLQENNFQVTVIPYLEANLTTKEIRNLFRTLSLPSARQMMRVGDPLYKELQLDDLDTTEKQLFEAMQTHPKLIERPIVVINGKAKIGRPPEQVLELFI